MSKPSHSKIVIIVGGVILLVVVGFALWFMQSMKNSGPFPVGNNSKPDMLRGVTTAEELKQKLGLDVTAPPVRIDVYNDGRILVDGVSMSSEEMDGAVREWKAAGKIVSYYREPGPDSPPELSDPISMEIIKTGVPLSPRDTPQPAASNK